MKSKASKLGSQHDNHYSLVITNPLNILDQGLFRKFGSFSGMRNLILLNVADVARDIHVYSAMLAW